MENIFNDRVYIIFSRDPFSPKVVGDCNGSYNNGQMRSVYAVKLKLTNAKQQIVFLILRIQYGCHRWPKLLGAVNMTLVTIEITKRL